MSAVARKPGRFVWRRPAESISHNAPCNGGKGTSSECTVSRLGTRLAQAEQSLGGSKPWQQGAAAREAYEHRGPPSPTHKITYALSCDKSNTALIAHSYPPPSPVSPPEDGVRLNGWRQSPSRALCALCAPGLRCLAIPSSRTPLLLCSHVAYHKSGYDDWGVHTER